MTSKADLSSTLSLEALSTLGNCRLCLTEDFARCVPARADRSRYTDKAERTAAARRIAAEIAEDGVFMACSALVGGDYVRVNAGTEAYRLVLQMKS